MEKLEEGLSRAEEACVQGCSNGKNKECLFMEHFGRRVGRKPGCRAASGAGPLGEPIGGKGKGTGVAGSSGRLGLCHRLACSDLWGQARVFPGVL